MLFCLLSLLQPPKTTEKQLEAYETRQGFSSLIFCSWGQNTSKYPQLLHLSVPTALQREGRGHKASLQGRRISNPVIACERH